MDASHNHDRILLVEDDELVQSVGIVALRRLGYEPKTADDGEEALTLAQADGETIDLLITDIVMPRMSGLELAKRLREAGLVKRVLFLSGYAKQDVLASVVDEPDFILLNKPFTIANFSNAVRSALDANE